MIRCDKLFLLTFSSGTFGGDKTMDVADIKGRWGGGTQKQWDNWSQFGARQAEWVL